MDKKLSPIALFVYNRLEHLKKTISYLLKNPETQNSDLYIFSDGPKNSDELHAINEIREYLKSVIGFKKIKIIKRQENIGLANSIIQGVTYVLEKYNTCI